ncbi:hypothetical protein P171DRAFT_113687 [Karstenula rhodostoma CBS 690.94]|uniref:Myb-like transcription factor n=1 Tax=Karstenula rhodostoma CBS 690.94 TaxID=1392251 RepID=A0A9P4U758_9PLEO|nr:hypothetical protein P171DRAFT_113687 [Karstenula rhodostoma CBS 690.94]
MSTSPASKRSLKPSLVAASTQQNAQLASSTELPKIQPAITAPPASFVTAAQPPPPAGARKRKPVGLKDSSDQMANASTTAGAADNGEPPPAADSEEPKTKKSRTNTPWTPAEEQRLKQMRDAGHSWSEIAKTFPQRTEGSVKKHWYKDMHYAEFGENESAELLAAIKEYDANKWKVVGQKVGKPAKACEQYAKEHFGGRV